ncbi:ssDNA endodeoxyribonuclease [Tyrophagus putrescentiae]|nr:ssDNA endodeoxyribonuclease [Tyrophagus putrescentiae]
MSQHDPYHLSSLSDVPGLTPMDSSSSARRALAANGDIGGGGVGTSQILRPNPPSFAGPTFMGEIEGVRALIPLLKAITIRKHAVMAITDRGLKITCEETSRSVQASAFFDRNLFKRYQLPDDRTLCFEFRMADLLTALNILFPEQHKSDDPLFDNSKVQLALKYPVVKDGGCEQLKLQVLGDHNEAAACVNTYNPGPAGGLQHIIIDAEPLIDFWRCADSTSSHLTLGISNDIEVAFEMATRSDRGAFLNRISPESGYVEHYECTVPMKNQYLMEHMKSTLRPLILASKVFSFAWTAMWAVFREEGDGNATAASGGGRGGGRTGGGGGGGGGGRANRGIMISQESSFSDEDLNDEVPKCFIEFYLLPSVEGV